MDTAEQGLYTSTRWRKLRAQKLQEDPFCEVCLLEHKISPATIVHHKDEVKAGGDPFEWSGLQSVCASHHRRLHG
jgi:5-methylcytosine-specific restriction protein A